MNSIPPEISIFVVSFIDSESCIACHCKKIKLIVQLSTRILKKTVIR